MTVLSRLFFVWQIPVVGCLRNSQGLTDLRHGVLVILGKGSQLLDLPRGQRLGSAKQPAARSGCLQPCVGSLPDEVPFKLRQRPEDVEHQLAAAGLVIDSIALKMP